MTLFYLLFYPLLALVERAERWLFARRWAASVERARRRYGA